MQPNVKLSLKAYQKIMYYVHASNFEVSGLGLVKYHKETNEYEVTDIFLLKQKNSSGDTEIDDIAYAELERDTFALQGEENGWLNFWWHSHVNMGVFWSGTDMACIKKFSQNGYWLATVFNKKNEMRSAIAVGEPVGAFQDNLPTTVDLLPSAEEAAELAAEYKLKVTNPTYTTNYGNSNRGSWNSQSSSTPAGGSATSSTKSDTGSSHSASATRGRSDEEDDELSLIEFMRKHKWNEDGPANSDPDIQTIMARTEAERMDISSQIQSDIQLANRGSSEDRTPTSNERPRVVRRSAP